MEEIKKVYGDKVIIEPIIEKDEIEDKYQKDNPYKTIRAKKGLIVAIGDNITLNVNIGDVVTFDNTISNKISETHIIINASQLLVRWN
jgi:hypothetical protein